MGKERQWQELYRAAVLEINWSRMTSIDSTPCVQISLLGANSAGRETVDGGPQAAFWRSTS
jgi:hypothetical protein